MTSVICYHTNIHGVRTNSFELFNGGRDDFDNWVRANPDKTVDYVFNQDHDIKDRHNAEREHFEHHAASYGLRPEYYLKCIPIPGAPVRLLDIKPGNRKYTIIIRDLVHQTNIKATPRYINDAIDKYGVVDMSALSGAFDSRM